LHFRRLTFALVGAGVALPTAGVAEKPASPNSSPGGRLVWAGLEFAGADQFRNVYHKSEKC
jgi:hypothetical protein